MIRIDVLWLCTMPMDMRTGAERLLAQVVYALGSANAHHGYLFANARATRTKMIVHGGFGVWCAARRLNVRRFVWRTRLSAASSTTCLAIGRRQSTPARTCRRRA